MTLRQTMRACRSLFRIRFTEGLQYRASAISGVFVSVFWGIIQCVILTVFYKYSQTPWNNGGMSLGQTISYIWLAEGLFALQAMSIDGEIWNKIKTGDIGIELCRPMDLYFHWLAKSSAGKIGTTWMRGLFTILVGALLPGSLRLGGPDSLSGFCLFILAVAMAFALCSTYAMFVTAIRVNITWGEGPTYMLLLISSVLSGGYLPLRLWPDFMQGFLRLQPFAGFTDIPAQLYIGTLSPEDAVFALAVQLAWIVIFMAAGRAILHRRLKSVIIQGG